MGILVRLIVEYGLRVAIVLLLAGLLYLAIRYVSHSNARVSSESEKPRSRNNKGPVEPEVCGMCSGPLDDNLKCEYCGTRHR